MKSKLVPMVVQFVPVLLLPLSKLSGVLLWPLFQVRVELVSSSRDGKSLMFDNLGDQESELLCLPNSMEQWDLFLRWYFLLHLKFLHVALMEPEDAIFDSLRVARCRSLMIFQALGWPSQIFPYLYEYQ